MSKRKARKLDWEGVVEGERDKQTSAEADQSDIPPADKPTSAEPDPSAIAAATHLAPRIPFSGWIEPGLKDQINKLAARGTYEGWTTAPKGVQQADIIDAAFTLFFRAWEKEQMTNGIDGEASRLLLTIIEDRAGL